MTRRRILVVLFTLTACSRHPVPWTFPVSLEGGWQLEKGPLQQPPDTVQAVYEGPAVVSVTLRDMRSSGTAFEALQKWRPVPGAVAFQHGVYFGLVESSAPNAILNAFIAALEKTMQ